MLGTQIFCWNVRTIKRVCVLFLNKCLLCFRNCDKNIMSLKYLAVFSYRSSSFLSISPSQFPLLTFWHRSFTFNSIKSPTWCNNFSVYYPDVCLQLNMFRAFSRPSSGAQWLHWQLLVFPSYRGDSRAVFVVGPAGPITNTARLSPRYEGKTRGCHCSNWAPDDGRENAPDVLNVK